MARIAGLGAKGWALAAATDVAKPPARPRLGSGTTSVIGAIVTRMCWWAR